MNKYTKEAYSLIGIDSISFEEIKLDHEWYVKMLQPIGITTVFSLANKGFNFSPKESCGFIFIKTRENWTSCISQISWFAKMV